MTRTSLTAMFAAALLGLVGAGSSWADESGLDGKESSSTKATQAPQPGPNDGQITAWLIAENGLHQQVSEFAAQRAQNSAVQQFAQAATQSRKDLVAQFHMPGQSEGKVASDVVTALREIAQRWEDTAGNNRQVLGFRGPVDREEQTETIRAAEERLADLRKKIQEQNKVLAEARRELRGDVAAAETRKEGRAELRADRGELSEAMKKLNDLRRQRLEAWRELAQARSKETGRVSVSDRVPQVLRTTAQILQEFGIKSAAASSLTDIEQQAAHRTAEAILERLKEKEGREFDRAYLGFEVLSQLRLISMLGVAKEFASKDLCTTLDRSLATAQERYRQAHDLLQQVIGSDKG
jgi:hypothetical protein